MRVQEGMIVGVSLSKQEAIFRFKKKEALDLMVENKSRKKQPTLIWPKSRLILEHGIYTLRQKKMLFWPHQLFKKIKLVHKQTIWNF